MDDACWFCLPMVISLLENWDSPYYVRPSKMHWSAKSLECDLVYIRFWLLDLGQFVMGKALPPLPRRKLEEAHCASSRLELKSQCFFVNSLIMGLYVLTF